MEKEAVRFAELFVNRNIIFEMFSRRIIFRSEKFGQEFREWKSRIGLKVSAGSRPGGRTFESSRSGCRGDPGSRDSHQLGEQKGSRFEPQRAPGGSGRR